MMLLMLMLCGTPVAEAQQISVVVEVPKLEARPYHRPYVAIWIETSQRQGRETLAVWHEQDEWLKDMRQWWRKLGRADRSKYDGVSGATRKPGTYTVQWSARDSQGSPLEPGEYFINIEAAREQGGRDFIKQKVKLGSAESQEYTLAGDVELGAVKITIKGVSHENQ